MKNKIDTNINTILLKLKHRLVEVYGDRLRNITLYGSNARGDAEPGSDIDVLVVLRDEVNPISEIDRTEHLVAEISLKYNVVIACVFTSEKKYIRKGTPLIMNIHKEGIPI